MEGSNVFSDEKKTNAWLMKPFTIVIIITNQQLCNYQKNKKINQQLCL